MTLHQKYQRLLEPGKIGNLQLKNRLVMASMGTRLAGLWGEVTDDIIEWYRTRARGGVGLVTVEAAHVAANLFPVRGVIKMLRADDDSFSPGLYRLAEAVHQVGSKISIQLSIGRAAATGAQWIPGASDLEDLAGMAPSATAFPADIRPREMTREEIKRTVKMFGKAAGRVKKVGFDAVELHAHFHSIPGCFLSPLFNRRSDEYGGSPENRLRFILEIVDSMRENLGTDFPILIKYSVNEFVEGGRDLEAGLEIARQFQENGVDGIVVSQGQAGSKQIPYAPLHWPPGYMVPLAAALKETVNIPIIVGGRLGQPALAEEILASGKADFISLGRPLIADPELPNKLQQGKASSIRQCLADNWCFEIFGKADMHCTLNFVAGQESRYSKITPAAESRRIVVIGAGPAGMEAARVAGLRGHQVWLLEKETSLGGGEIRLAAVPPHKEVFSSIADYYQGAFKDLPNVTIQMGREADINTISSLKPDAVIVATGAESLVPNLPGVEREDVTTAFAVLSGKNRITDKDVVICGGNGVGCETAVFLAGQGNRVTVVEMLDNIGPDIEPITLAALKEELGSLGVKIITGHKVQSITEGGVEVEDKQGKRSILPADVPVLALGVAPVNNLAGRLNDTCDEVYTIGDANKPGKIHDAIADGFLLGISL